MVLLTTKQGKLEGFKRKWDSCDVSIFKNVPFARVSRFQKPKPYGKWDDETFDATGRCTSAPQDIKGAKQFGMLAPVMPFRENHVVFEDEPYIVDEHRLALNVYVPGDLKTKKPVMVWIHGGHFQFGCGEQEDPTVLSAFGDVIVVSICYRMNVFGFLFGNWGLFDQIEALKWVRDNIGDYGGDNSNVTVFGQSAGAWAVESLLCTDLSEGLFHKAICQSGCIKSNVIKDVNQWSNAKSMPVLMEVFGAKNEEDLKGILQTIPLAEFHDKWAKICEMKINVEPTFDRDFFKDDPRTCGYKQLVPVMTGFNSSEGAGMMPFFVPPILAGIDKQTAVMIYSKFAGLSVEKCTASLDHGLSVYEFDENDPARYSKLLLESYRDEVFGGCFNRAAEQSSKQRIYLYGLDHQFKMFHEAPYKGSSPITRWDWCKSDHGDDLMLVFGDGLHDWTQFSQGKSWTTEEAALSKRIMRAWSDFAKIGDPGFKSFNESKSQHVFAIKDYELPLFDGVLSKRYSFWLSGYTGVPSCAF